jgi:DNA-binding transcriptional MerR regulator
MATTLSPSRMAAHVDLSLDTLRHYERAGSMPRVQRLADTFGVTAGEATP